MLWRNRDGTGRSRAAGGAGRTPPHPPADRTALTHLVRRLIRTGCPVLLGAATRCSRSCQATKASSRQQEVMARGDTESYPARPSAWPPSWLQISLRPSQWPRPSARHSSTRRTRLVVRGRARASWRLGRIDQAETGCYLLGEAGLAAPQSQARGGGDGSCGSRGGRQPRARRVPAHERIGDLRLPSCCSGKPCASRDLRRLAHCGHG
jgi:hypothetical protein